MLTELSNLSTYTMKNLLIFFSIIFLVPTLHAQDYCSDYCYGFEDTICMKHVLKDTASGNLWQTGKPQKNVINSAIFSDNAIITDTINVYPENNLSIFTIRSVASWGDVYGFRTFSGYYNVHTDSLKDYGTIEYSPDMGTTWIDLVSDTLYSSGRNWYSTIPVLTGCSGGWRSFECTLADYGSVFELEMGDTLLYRFSFISDSLFDDMDGLAFDNICFTEFVEGISPIRFVPIQSRLYPNPARDLFTIEFENPEHRLFELAIYDIQSKLQFTVGDITGNAVEFNAAHLKPGIYVYKLTGVEDHRRSWGKFVVAE